MEKEGAAESAVGECQPAEGKHCAGMAVGRAGAKRNPYRNVDKRMSVSDRPR